MAPAQRPQENPPIVVCGASNLVRRPTPTPSPSHSSVSSAPSTSPSPRLPTDPNPQDRLTSEAARLAPLIRTALTTLSRLGDFNPSLPCTREEILRLPLHDPSLRPPEELLNLPRRKSRRMPLAAAVAALVFPAHAGSLAPLIRYEAERVRLRGWGVVAREFGLMVGEMGRFGGLGGAVPRVELGVLNGRIMAQGAWDAERDPVSLDGVSSGKTEEALASGDVTPLLRHLESGGGAQPGSTAPGAVALNDGLGEPHYGVRGLEFPRGILLADGRLDLYKTGVGAHIEPLMQSLKRNTFVQHVQLGNNAHGRRGCDAIADYLAECPDRIESWYLAGNDVDAAGLGVLVDGLVKSRSVSGVFLKGNPLGSDAVPELLRLVTTTENLRVLDLDETRLGDGGVTRLFEGLAAHLASGSMLPLEAIYLNGNGISTSAAAAISRFLALQGQQGAPNLHSLYLSYNPLGNAGAEALSEALPICRLRRLTLQSTGLGTRGAIALANSLHNNPTLRVLDLSQGAATARLKQAFNYIEDSALPALYSLVESTDVQCLSLGHCALTPPALSHLAESVARSRSLLTYFAASIHLTNTEMYARPFVPAQGSARGDSVTGAALTRKVGEAEGAAARKLEGNVAVGFGVAYAAWKEGARGVLVEGVRGVDSAYRGRDFKALGRDVSDLVE